MTSRLKSLELQGYKTFANRTLFEFSDTVTVIVGPNGSGKSNIADSIRWVLGEQSYSLLRGKRTVDMIFSGSEYRARSGMASATITFDNSSGWLPIDFSEVAITRRAYRDGQNEYLINGQRARLKDVSELLAQSGLAERTYTIIGQGLVDAALALKAEERRKLFEEAAGIGLYRSRREEALRRLDKTERNIERVQDIILELQPRLRSLERQSRKANRYHQVKSDLLLLLREWYGYHWHKSQTDLSKAIENARTQEKVLIQAREMQISLSNLLTEKQNHILNLRQKLNSMHRQSAELHTKREALSRELAVLDERIKGYIQQKQNTNSEIARIEEELGSETERYLLAQKDVSKKEKELIEARKNLDNLRQALAEKQASQEETNRNIQEAQALVERLTSQLGRLEILSSEREIQYEKDRNALELLEKTILSVEGEHQAALESLTNLENKIKRANDQLERNAINLEQIREQQNDLQQELTRKMEYKAQLISEISTIKTQLNVLNQADAKLSGYAEGTRVLLTAARKSKLKGLLGPLNKELNVPEELEIAITSALGEFIDAVVLKSDVDEAIDMLISSKQRGVLLPLDSIENNVPSLENEIKTENGYIGIASNLVAASPKIATIINQLLGRTIVVRDRKTAKRFVRKLRKEMEEGGNNSDFQNYRVVTLNGSIYYPGGPIITGLSDSSTREQSLLGLSRQVRTLNANKQKVDEKLRQVEQEIRLLVKREKEILELKEEAKNKLSAAQSELDDLNVEMSQAEFKVDRAIQKKHWQVSQKERLIKDIDILREEIEQMSEKKKKFNDELLNAREEYRAARFALDDETINDLNEEVNHWEKIVALIEMSLEDNKSRLLEREQSLVRIKETYKQFKSRKSDYTELLENVETERSTKRLLEAEIEEELQSLQLEIKPSENELEHEENEQLSIQKEEATARKELSEAEHLYAQMRIALSSKQDAFDSLRRQIENDIGLVDFNYAEKISGPTPLPLEGYVKNLPVVTSLSPDLEKSINRLRTQLRRMGPINPEAQKEYEEINDRYTFLNEQIADLQKAESDVREVINELDEIMEREFRKTFDAVAEEFKEIFARLFKGGSSRLVLTDPQDITNSGIDIEARLPGRRTQRLSLLSGGERSLTATALIFALLKVSPTPFCLLDEVDAMLDEANLVRFRELLQELSSSTQFVIVTHNRNTVQAADVIYGITMGRDSASQVVSLKPNDVIKAVV